MRKSISEEIDVIRGLAALGVICGHTLYTVTWPINGAFWVWIFFIVSGYLQGNAFFAQRYGLDKKGVKRFWTNRVLRILPLFWLSMVFSILFHVFFHEKIGFIQGIRQFTALTFNYTLIGPLWTIATELHFYLMVPFLCLIFRKFTDEWFVIAALICAYYLYVIEGRLTDNFLNPKTVIGNLMLFFVGMFIAKNRLTPKSIKGWMKALIVGSAILCVWGMNRLSMLIFWHGGGMLLAVAIGYCILAFDRGDKSMPKILTPFGFVGRYCYGVYVYSALIGTVYLMGWNIQPGIKAFILQMMGIPVAVLSYKIFERKFLALKV